MADEALFSVLLLATTNILVLI